MFHGSQHCDPDFDPIDLSCRRIYGDRPDSPGHRGCPDRLNVHDYAAVRLRLVRHVVTLEQAGDRSDVRSHAVRLDQPRSTGDRDLCSGNIDISAKLMLGPS